MMNISLNSFEEDKENDVFKNKKAMEDAIHLNVEMIQKSDKAV